METASLRQLFFRHLAQTSPYPLAVQVDKAEGVWLYGPEKKYLDLISGISVSSIGHRAPEVLEAMRNQLDRYLHTMVYGELILSPQVELATQLAAAIGNGIDSVYFVNSGSEANEGALKLAKRHTGRKKIIAFEKSYHGSTHGALSVTGSDELKNGYGPFLPGITFIPYNEIAALDAIDSETACVIAEPIQGEAGVRVPSGEFLQALRKRCTETGTLLILDEIQTAYGRTGSLFAFQHFGIVPDILTLAKGIGGGMPLAAFCAPRAIMTSLSHDPILGHITTFGGHPVNCAAGIATLKKVQDENLCARVPSLEKIIRDAFAENKKVNLRGMGLLFAVQLENMDLASRALARCIERGVLTDFFLHAPDCLRIAPPLTISEEELSWALQQMNDAISEITTH